MIECEARTVLPSTHDIDFMWNATWDKEKEGRTAYIVGIQGWMEGKAGFEKLPDYRLVATAPLFHFQPGHLRRSFKAYGIDPFVHSRMVKAIAAKERSGPSLSAKPRTQML
jgi:hypothetical protein